MARYAIYFAPDAASPLWQFGSAVIGYDAATGEPRPFVTTFGHSIETWSDITAEPRRYGFHATLKAPFEVVAGADEPTLLAAAEQIAASMAPAELVGLEARALGRFVALVPSVPSEKLQTLAAAVVTHLDNLRAPLSASDRERRLKSPLTARQIDYLDRYGYPYVLDEFRFHMTLTGPIAQTPVRDRVCQSLAAAFAKAVPAGSVAVDALAVYRQDRRDARFRMIARFLLTRDRAISAPR
jgi:putative phosphonate metabolism protein